MADTPYKSLRIRAGLRADLPVLNVREFGFCTDTHELFIGTQDGNQLVPVYIPATPAHWANPAPTNAADAIDRLAAAVSSLLGGTIP